MTGDRKQQGINANDSTKVDIAQVVQHFAPPESRDRTETKLLDAVKNEVAGRLAQSLHQRVYVELDKTEDSTQVVPPWSLDVKLGNASSQRCPEGIHIVDIFDRAEIGGRLLVLGAPGSGKTTMLLQLAEELVKRGQENAAYPVPVLLNLSAWKSEFRDIPSWMVSDLKLKYGVRKDITEKWIEEGRILPLLDGLDELMSQRQETCVQALNEFLPTWSGTPLVVCSRLEEYQLYETNLGLNGAVILQPLTDRQIETYLRSAKCDWLWDAVRIDADVMDAKTGLARSPLLLTILVLSSDKLPVELWKQQESVTERRRILFEAYIDARLQRPYRGGANLPATQHGRKPYEKDKKTKYWLGWLAVRLIEEYDTEFFIEELQPYYIESRRQKIVYGLTIGLVYGLVIGLFVALVTSLFFNFLHGLVWGLFWGLIFFIKGIQETPDFKTIECKSLYWNFNLKKILKKAIYILVFSLVCILFFVLMFYSILGVLHGLIYGIFYAFSVGIAILSTSEKKSSRFVENQDIYHPLIKSLTSSLLLIPLCMLIPISIHFLYAPMKYKEILGQGIGLSFALGTLSPLGNSILNAIDHLALRITLWLFGYSPWNYRTFLRYCTERGFLQRVGGGYRFVHALLREHFAKEYGDLK
ncbi:NACHT domain-containing protein [Baaleninema simplex]|uniref:NACHT domain-containing protein n=1 Tax=Baaleninema simplex TaxID=2862350 RepID=UPI000348A8F3|nr:NACHT domain-containing protein [Baaleninema simplex]